MQTFLQRLFECYPADKSLRIEIRPLLPEWRKEEMTDDAIRLIHWEVRRWFALSPAGIEAAQNYAKGYAEAFDVYYGVLARRGNSGKQDDVFFAPCLFCDIDGGDAGYEGSLELLSRSGLPSPQICVVSGGGLHCYWKLMEIVSLPDREARDRYKRILRRICQAIGSNHPGAHADTSAGEVARILRLPDTYNLKRPEEPRLVRIVSECDSPIYSYEHWSLHLLPQETAPVQALSPRRYDTGYTQGFISEGLLRWASEGYPEDKRHKDLTSAAAWLVRDCKVSKADALELLRQKAAHSAGRRAITERELEEIVKWA